MRIICLTLILSFICSFWTSVSNAGTRYPLLKDKAGEILGAEERDDGWGAPSGEVDALIDKYASNRDLYPLIEKMFAVADTHIAAVNARLDEVEAAAKSCDRTRYDAAKNRLIEAYVKASLYLQRKLDSIDALSKASGEYESGSNYEAAKRRWSMFWAAVHDTLGNDIKISEAMAEIWKRNSTSYRAELLGYAYSAAYGQTLKKMETVIKTADYPEFKDCDEGDDNVDQTALDAEADAALAEALAAQKAMDALEKELDEQDRTFEKLKDEMDTLVGDANIPSDVSSEGSVGELPIIPDPMQSPDGSFQTPDFGALMPPSDVVIDIPDMPKIPQVPKDSPLAKMQADPCGQNPKKVCSVLLKEFRKDCTKELKAFYKICKKGPSIKDCKKRCEANWKQGVHQNAIAELAKKHIRAVYGQSEDTHEDDYEDKEAEIKANEERVKQIEADAKKRILHIYINTNTDTIIRHNGHKFEPKPPLRYGGTEGGGLYMHERNLIANLKARNEKLRREIDGLVDSTHDDNAWIKMALSKWTADAKKNDGLCTPEQNDTNRDACVAECEGKAPAAVLHACYSSFVPQLVMPYGRTYLYPPGHPESDPKKGL